MNKKSKIIPFSILTMLLVIGSGVLSSCSTPSTSVEPTTITTTTTPVVEVSSVTLDITEVSLEVEATKKLTATVLPVTATVKTITWSSSDKAIATVSDAGLVTAIKAGTATISAKVGSKTATCVVTVTPKIIAVESISLDKTTASIEAEKTMTLVATVLPDTATVKTVAWTSSAEDVATVVDGLVTAKKAGTATITAKAGSATATCAVTVTPKIIAVESISLDHATASIEAEKTMTLVATVLPDTATVKTVTWTTSAAEFAIVSDKGVVTGVAAGEATITAKAGSATATCVVTVTPKIIAVESISLDKTSISLEELATQTLVASILPDTATDQTVTWTTSAEDVATVVEGLVTAKKAGQATITAIAGSATATCAVTVTAPTAGSIAITGAKELYATNEDMIVSLDVTMSNGVIKNYANVNLATGLNKPEGATISGFDTVTDGKKSGTINIDSKTSTINYVVYQAVDSEATLRTLVESTIDKTPIIIGLTKDITILTKYYVTRPFILYGITSGTDKNITIDTLATSTGPLRIFEFDATTVPGSESLINSSIEFHNITMDLKTVGVTDLRANAFRGCDAINVVYDNTILKTANYYAINISSGNDDSHFTIKNNSIISGWSAINLWSLRTIFDIENSTLIGTNNMTGPSDDFSTIVVNNLATNSIINIKNSTINAIANTDIYQHCIDLRNNSAKVNFSGANSVSIVKKSSTNKTPCYIIGLTAQIVGIEFVTTTDVPAVKMIMPLTEVYPVSEGK